MLKKIVLAIFLLSVIVHAESLEQIEKELKRIGEEVQDAILKGDLYLQLKYYADDAIIMPDFHPMVKGKRGLKQLLDENRMHGTVYHTFNGNTTKLWTCGKKIFVQGVFSTSISNKYDNKPIAINGSYFTIWERQDDGKLLITHDMWNLDHPIN